MCEIKSLYINQIPNTIDPTQIMDLNNSFFPLSAALKDNLTGNIDGKMSLSSLVLYTASYTQTLLDPSFIANKFDFNGNIKATFTSSGTIQLNYVDVNNLLARVTQLEAKVKALEDKSCSTRF